MEWSACVDWADRYINLHDQLLRAKEVAQDTKLAKESGGDMVTFGEWQLLVAPSGMHCGVHYAFRLSGPGVLVLMQDRQRPRDMAPNVMVRSDGRACLQWGGMGCLERGRALLVSMGAKIEREMLSRVDLALDVPGVGMGEFAAAYQDRRYITRAKDRGCHESSGISIYLGKSPLRLRIYDKRAEIVSGCDPLKTANMLDKRWHGMFPQAAIRVEFELRREALKEHGIDTPDDYFCKRADLAAYLCNEWIRFTVDAVDRANTTRATVLPLWLTVADGFRAWTGEPAGLLLTPLEPGYVNVEQLERQGVGVLLTAAVQSFKANNVEQFTEYCGRVVADYLVRANWKREVAVRMV